MSNEELTQALRGLMMLVWENLPAIVPEDHPQIKVARMMRKTSLWLRGFEENPWQKPVQYVEFIGDGKIKTEEGWWIEAADCPHGYRHCVGIGDPTLTGVKYRKPATQEAKEGV